MKPTGLWFDCQSCMLKAVAATGRRGATSCHQDQVWGSSWKTQLAMVEHLETQWAFAEDPILNIHDHAGPVGCTWCSTQQRDSNPNSCMRADSPAQPSPERMDTFKRRFLSANIEQDLDGCMLTCHY